MPENVGAKSCALPSENRSTNMTGCASEETLRIWLAGALGPIEQEVVSTHVRKCARCQRTLEAETQYTGLRQWLQAGQSTTECELEATELDRIVDKFLATLAVVHEPAVARPCSRSAAGARRGEVGGNLDRIGRFRILGELGRGGMAIVYRAWDEMLGRVVAVKVLRPDQSDLADRQRLVREAQLAARFHNDHAVTVHEVVDPPDGMPYLVMEHVKGPTLAALATAPERPVPRRIAALLAQVADALEAAHQAGLIHRDVKPSNILIDEKADRAKIADFGLARAEGGESRLTKEGCLAGTPTYMSPEQARGTSDLDARTDIYSLGATLYEGLTGETPFRGAPHLVLRQVIEEDPRPLRELNDQIPRDLETICLMALAKEPARRYQTAGAMATDLRHSLAGEPIVAQRIGTVERAWRWCRRRPVIASLVVALVLVVTAGFAGTFSQWQRAERQRDQALSQHALAERNFRQAREAVDSYLTQVSESDALKAQNLEPLRRDLLRTARDFYERFVQQDPGDRQLQVELAKAHERLGVITSILESRPKAVEHYQRMRAIFERLHEGDADDPTYQRGLAESWYREGESYRAGVGPAEDAFLRARALQETLVRAHPKESVYEADLARTLRSLGNLYLFLSNKYDLAEQTLVEARDICIQILPSAAHGPAIQFEYAIVLLSLAKVYAHTDRWEQQRTAAEAASTVFDSLMHAHVGNPDYRYYFTDSLSELGDAYRALAQPDRAHSTWQTALNSATDLMRDHPVSGHYRHVVADIAYSLASLAFHERRQPDEARPLLEQALEIEEELNLTLPGIGEYNFYLNNIFRDFRDWYADIAPLVAWRDRLEMVISEQEQAARLAPEKVDRDRLKSYCAYRAFANTLIGHYMSFQAELRKKLPKEIADSVREAPLAFRLALHGDYTGAASEAKAIAARDVGNGSSLYEAAEVSARLARMASNDQSLAADTKQELIESFSTQAVEWIKKAQSLKYLSAPSTRWLLADDRDLAALRDRADFRALLAARSVHAAK
jgi:tRNA A-37 threonylcarbamoyl transferase component Bud32